MLLLTNEQRQQLLRNHAATDWGALSPVVKLFTPDAAATWLLTAFDPEDGDTLWGLCDLGVGFPELGNVSFAELMALRGTLGLPVERDLLVELPLTTDEYADLARVHGHIVLG